MGSQLIEQPDVTAIFVANDQMALGLLRALHERGHDVPGDISLVGFDDIPESEFFTPPLTTVRQDFNEMGQRALHLLLEEISTGERMSTRATVPDLARGARERRAHRAEHTPSVSAHIVRSRRAA